MAGRLRERETAGDVTLTPMAISTVTTSTTITALPTVIPTTILTVMSTVTLRFTVTGRLRERETADDVPPDPGAADLHNLRRHGADVRGVHGAFVERPAPAGRGANIPSGVLKRKGQTIVSDDACGVGGGDDDVGLEARSPPLSEWRKRGEIIYLVVFFYVSRFLCRYLVQFLLKGSVRGRAPTAVLLGN